MSRTVVVHPLPSLFEPPELRGGVAVVIDVLRASTTICHALEAGAECVIPVGEVEDARRRAAACEAGTVLLGGERGGERIAGFDLGNSPSEYTPDVVGGKTVVFTTTNGTRALLRSAEAARIVVGCFANLHAVLTSLAADDRDVHLVCAGTDGRITQEDVLFAGALAAALLERCKPQGDSTTLALALFRSAGDRDGLDRILRDSRGGRNLARLGMSGDVELAGRWDTTSVVPVFDPATGRLTAERFEPALKHPGWSNGR